MNLGEKLRRQRKIISKLTLKEVSNSTGLSISFLSDIERGRTNPSLETIFKLAKVYNVGVNELIPDKFINSNIPKELEKFKEEYNIQDEFIDLMLQVEFRSNKEYKSIEDWKQLYFSLKTIIGD